MISTDNPCWKCTERELRCHGRCQKRAEWEKKRSEESERINTARREERKRNAYVFEHIEKSKKRRHK